MLIVGILGVTLGLGAHAIKLFADIGRICNDAFAIRASAAPTDRARQAEVDRLLQVAGRVNKDYQRTLVLAGASAVVAILVLIRPASRLFWRLVLGVPSPSVFFASGPLAPRFGSPSETLRDANELGARTPSQPTAREGGLA
jgi:hypothetical protein